MYNGHFNEPGPIDFLEFLPSPCIYLNEDTSITYINAAARGIVNGTVGSLIFDTNFAEQTSVDLKDALKSDEILLPPRLPQESTFWQWRLCKKTISGRALYCLIAQLTEHVSDVDLLRKLTHSSYNGVNHCVTLCNSDLSVRTMNDTGMIWYQDFASRLTADRPGPYWGSWSEDFTEQIPMSESAAATALRNGKSMMNFKRGIENPTTGVRTVVEACVTLLNHPSTNDLLGAIVQVPMGQEWSEYIRRYDIAARQSKTTVLVKTMLLNGQFDFFCAESEKFFDRSRADLSNTWIDFVHPEDRSRIEEAWATALRTGQMQEVEVRYRTGTTFRYFLDRIAPYEETTRWYCIGTDIHDLVSERKAADSARDRLYSLIGELEVVIFEIDRNYVFTSCEGSMTIDLTTGDRPPVAELVGKSVSEAMGSATLENVDEIAAAFGGVMQGRSAKSVVEYKNGSRNLRSTLVPVRDDTAVTGLFGITVDLTAEYENRQALAQIEAMKQSSRMKDEFVANVSHELRTPIAGLLGLLELLYETELNSEQADLTQSLQVSAKALSRIVNDILDFSKAEANAMVIENTPFDLAALLHSITKSGEALTNKKHLELQCNSPDQLNVIGDALRLRQMWVILKRHTQPSSFTDTLRLDNLLSNAIKFTDHGYIHITMSFTIQEKVAVQITIKDTGPGMDEETVAKLFQPFVQADQSTTRLYGGTGLGLSIARKLARAMGGDVNLTSAKGVGTTSILTLLLDLDPTLRPAIPHVASDHTPVEGFGDRRVLVVEDNKVNMIVLKGHLKKLGIKNIASATNGEEAVAHVTTTSSPPDLIFMDCQMPILDGFDATKQLRSAHFDKPIIALTASATIGYRQKCLDAGMNDYVTKPFTRQQLCDTMISWLDTSQQDDKQGVAV